MSSTPPDATPKAAENSERESEARPRIPLKMEDWLTVIIMGALALITFANVLVRYFTDASFAWTEEVSVFLMIVLAMVAGSAAVARNRHIRIEFFADSGPLRRQRALARFGAAMVALLFALMAVLSIRLVWDDFQYGETSPGIGVPQWWYSIWLPIISVAITFRAIGLMLRGGVPAADVPGLQTSPEARAEERAP